MRGTGWLIIGSLIQLIGWTFLTLLSKGMWTPSFAYEVNNNDMPTWTFFWVQGALAVFLLLTLWFSIWKAQKDVSIKWVAIYTIAISSILLRGIALFGEPIHESDFYRYIWDGKVADSGINPYRFEPGALLLRESGVEYEYPDDYTGVTWRGRKFNAWENEALDQLDLLRADNPTLFERVSHKAVTTIYPPFAQIVFYTSFKLFGDSNIGIKFMFVCFDLGVVALLIAGLKRLGRNPIYAILYAWNPLVIKEFANSGHYDSVAIFFMIAALIFAASSRLSPFKKGIGIAIMLALGTLSKYFAILLLPILLVAVFDPGNQPFLRRIKTVFWNPFLYLCGLIFLLVISLISLPYLRWDDAGFGEFFRGLSTYEGYWKYSPGGFAIIEQLAIWFNLENHPKLPKLIAMVILCCSIALIALFSKRSIGWRCFAAMSLLFFLSPTAFPWYFCWALVFIPFQNRTSWVILALLLPINYIDFHSFENIPLARVVWHGWYATQLISWGVFAIWWITESGISLFRLPKANPSATIKA